MSFVERYERFGWDYRRTNPMQEIEADWYLRHARETGGPVLELACGQGSLLEALAVQGHEVVGLDLAPAMLALARRRLAGLPEEIRGRVSLVRGDMSRFSLGRTFPLVIIADNSFRAVQTVAKLTSCLRCVRRHLCPGGRLLVTERRFVPEEYPDDGRLWPWSPPYVNPDTGDVVRRRVRARIDRERMWLTGEMTYRVTDPEGVETEEVFRFENPVFDPEGYRRLFAQCGFTVELFEGYSNRSDEGRDPTLCFVCRS